MYFADLGIFYEPAMGSDEERPINPEGFFVLLKLLIHQHFFNFIPQ